MKSRHAKSQFGPLTDSPAESTQRLKKDDPWQKFEIISRKLERTSFFSTLSLMRCLLCVTVSSLMINETVVLSGVRGVSLGCGCGWSCLGIARTVIHAVFLWSPLMFTSMLTRSSVIMLAHNLDRD